MADLVTLAEAKTWLRILSDDFDAELSLMIPAASDAVLEFADAWDGTSEIPPRLRVAALSRIASMFEDREKIGPGPHERGLIQPLRTLDL